MEHAAEPRAGDHGVTNGNGGLEPTDRDLLEGIAAKVSRIDRDLENVLTARVEERRLAVEDRRLLRQIARDVREYHRGMQKLSDLWLKIYQERIALPDPQKPGA